ncbi:MAG: asparagine synthase (glutamine-hydrolyzing), partial [Aeromicrobium sp.]|nr:asparagine synthase (glutamine-hydrolyzing) [Burkholderiales bacterium]
HENVHLGHRRLAVIDIAASTQPMTTADGRHTIVFNGEIYNYRSLRDELRAFGRHFATNGDTEVMLQAVAQWGDGALQRVEGMFAFASFDKVDQTLLVARDHLGVKPLHFVADTAVFAFASELKALTEHPAVSKNISLDALGLFLECQYIPAPLTIYRNVYKLEAGHALRLSVNTGDVAKWQYWSLDYQQKLAVSDDEAIDMLDRELRRSVESMLVADVPLGAFVSGGVDSSVVAALMTDLTGKSIETFNLGFLNPSGAPDTTESEHDEAAKVATHLGSNHHALMVKPSDVTDAFSEWVDVFDEPFGDQAALPTMLLSKLTRQHVTVALTGEGADELFSGYANYRKRVSEERISGVLGASGSPFPALLKMLPAAARKDRLIKAIMQPLAKRYATIPNVFDRALQPALFSDALLAAQRTHIADYAAKFHDECNARDYIEKIMYVDMRLWLPDDLLTKVDRATMAYSLEARVPYLDHKFVEFVARLDPALKQRGKTTKYALKKLASRYLPEEIVYRNKQGFVMPLTTWLQSSLKPQVDAALGSQGSGGLARRGLFREGALATLQAEHSTGRSNHAGRIWALTVLEQWFQRYAPEFSL